LRERLVLRPYGYSPFSLDLRHMKGCSYMGDPVGKVLKN
jgi:hypothetical protein